MWSPFCCSWVDIQEVLLPAAISSLPYHFCCEEWCSVHFRVPFLVVDETTQRSYRCLIVVFFSPTASHLPVPVWFVEHPNASIGLELHPSA